MCRFYRWIFVGILLALSTGCASIYQSPLQGASAYISAPTRGFFPENVIVIYQNPYACKSPSMGTFSQRMHGSPIQIAANQLTSITVQHPVPNKVLVFTFTFIPQNGYSYIIKTTLTPMRGSQAAVTLQLLGADQQGQLNNNYHLILFIKRNLERGLFLASAEQADKLLQKQLLNGQYYNLPKTTSITQIVNNVLVMQS